MNPTPPVVVALGELLWDLFPDGARFGGAPGNFAHHAASLGGNVFMVSAVGDDGLGVRAIESLRRSQIDVSQVAVDHDHASGSVEVELDAEGIPSYRFHENESWDFLRWSDELAKLADRCDAVCFGTLGQRSKQSRDTIQRFVSATRITALRVFDINLRAPYFNAPLIENSLALANVLKANQEELAHLATQFGLRSRSEIDRAEELRKRFGLRMVAVTRGEGGAFFVQQGEVHDSPALPTDVVDTVGAGDAFLAAMVLGLLQSFEIKSLAAWSCRIAEFVCSQPGATPKLPESLVSQIALRGQAGQSP